MFPLSVLCILKLEKAFVIFVLSLSSCLVLSGWVRFKSAEFFPSPLPFDWLHIKAEKSRLLYTERQIQNSLIVFNSKFVHLLKILTFVPKRKHTAVDIRDGVKL